MHSAPLSDRAARNWGWEREVRPLSIPVLRESDESFAPDRSRSSAPRVTRAVGQGYAVANNQFLHETVEPASVSIVGEQPTLLRILVRGVCDLNREVIGKRHVRHLHTVQIDDRFVAVRSMLTARRYQVPALSDTSSISRRRAPLFRANSRCPVVEHCRLNHRWYCPPQRIVFSGPSRASALN